MRFKASDKVNIDRKSAYSESTAKYVFRTKEVLILKIVLNQFSSKRKINRIFTCSWHGKLNIQSSYGWVFETENGVVFVYNTVKD